MCIFGETPHLLYNLSYAIHVVSAREASGFPNMAVWTALNRKGLAIISDPLTITLTARGVGYETGLGERFLTESDH